MISVLKSGGGRVRVCVRSYPVLWGHYTVQGVTVFLTNKQKEKINVVLDFCSIFALCKLGIKIL